MSSSIDDQIRALAPLSASMIARLAGYAHTKQLNDYRRKGRLMPIARLEKLAVSLEELTVITRRMKNERG